MLTARNIPTADRVQSPMRPSAVARIVALCLVLGACTSAPDPQPSSSASATAGLSPDVDVCPITSAGAPAGGGITLASLVETAPHVRTALDQPGGSGEEAGPGGWQLCMEDGSIIQGSGLCHWSADRTEVLWVIGDEARGLGARVGPFVSFEEDPDVLVLDRADAEGILAGYRPTPRTSIEVSTTPNRDAGFATFRTLQLHDPATGEPVRGGWEGPESLAVDGVLRWACASAPPFSEGWGPGLVRVAIDEPVGSLTWEASCWWALADDGSGTPRPVVTAVDGEFTPSGDQELSIHVSPLDDQTTFTLTTQALRLEESRSSTYTVGDTPPRFTARAPDGSAGQLRFSGWRRLQPMEGDPEEPVGGPGGPVEIDGTVEWRCGEPLGELAELESPEPTPDDQP